MVAQCVNKTKARESEFADVWNGKSLKQIFTTLMEVHREINYTQLTQICLLNHFS